MGNIWTCTLCTRVIDSARVLVAKRHLIQALENVHQTASRDWLNHLARDVYNVRDFQELFELFEDQRHLDIPEVNCDLGDADSKDLYLQLRSALSKYKKIVDEMKNEYILDQLQVTSVLKAWINMYFDALLEVFPYLDSLISAERWNVPEEETYHVKKDDAATWLAVMLSVSVVTVSKVLRVLKGQVK